MGTTVIIGLVIIAIVLFVSVQIGFISDNVLQRLANIAGILALIAAAAVFVVPAATPPSEPPPLPPFAPTPSISSAESVLASPTTQNFRIIGTVPKSKSLGVRTGPGFEYELLMTLSSQSDDVRLPAIVMHNSRDWVLVRLPKRITEGWVLANTTSIEWNKNPNILSTVPYPLVTGSVIDGSLPVRSEPNVQSDLLKTLSLKERVIAAGRSSAGDWIFVLLPDGTEGWVLKRSKFVEWSGDLNILPEKST